MFSDASQRSKELKQDIIIFCSLLEDKVIYNIPRDIYDHFIWIYT